MARGWEVHWKHHAKGNPNCRSNQNPILNTYFYNVEFQGGETTELAANIIAESLYPQCDANGNNYLLLEAFMRIVVKG